MNIAIVGSSGYIAKFLINRFNNEKIADRILKIDQTDDADEYLNLLEPQNFNYKSLNDIDFVVFTAAISGPDKCAQDYDWCWSINVTGTNYFIHEAIKRNCRVLFFSSDAVFGDIPGHIYDENSKTEAKTPYGMMKKAVEDKFKGSPLFKAIRLSYVASRKDRFVSYCLGCIEQNETADVFHPFYRNCIVVSDVEDVVVYFARNWDLYPHTFLNVAGTELVSRVRIADELNRILDNRLKYTVSTPDDSFYKNRPRITQMRSLYIYEMNIINNVSFTERIQKEMLTREY